MQRNTDFKLLLICTMFLSACTFIQPYKGFTNTVLGTSATDESCELKKGSMLFDTVGMPGQLFNIFCGDWEWPSARIFKIDAGTLALPSLKQGDIWENTRERRMTCDKASQDMQQQSFLNSNIKLFHCKLHNGGWPYLALIVELNGSTYMADGIPATLVVIQQAIATLAGVENVPATTQSASIEYLHQQYKDKLYSSKDLQAYYRAITLGQYYNSIKAFPKAEAQYWQALKQHQKALGLDNSETGDALMHIALELSNQEQFVRAGDMFDKVNNKIDVKNNLDDNARLFSYQALHNANQSDFEDALKLAGMATQIRLKQQKGITSTGPQVSNVNKSESISSSKDFDLIWPDGLRSAPAEAVQSLYIEAAMLERLAKNEKSKETREQKLKESKQKLEHAKYLLATTEENPPLWEPQVENLDGVIALSNQDQKEAEEAQGRALEIFEQRAPNKRPSMLSLIDLGKLNFNQEKFEKATTYYRKALRLAKKRSNSFRLSQLEPYFTYQLGKGRSLKNTGREMFEAAQLVLGGITAKEIARTVARFGKKTEQHDSKNKHDPVRELIAKLQKQEFMRAKTQRKYQVELGSVLEQGHMQRLEKLTAALDTIDQKIAQLNLQVQTISPGYQQLINSAVDTDDVIKALSQDEALLQVLVGEQQSYVFFIHKNRVEAYSVSIPVTEITSTVDLLRTTIKRKDSSIVEAVDKAYELYNKLFGPISADINAVSHLITVPSGPLLSFPFELFVTESPSDNNQSSAVEISSIAWLVKTTTISLVPSAQSFVYLRQHVKPSTASKSLIAFGDFVPFNNKSVNKPKNLKPLCQLIGNYVHFNFAELAGTRLEIEKVAATFTSVSADDLFLKTRFTENAVKSQNLNEYRIIYFATHALLPDQIDCRGQPSLITSVDTTNNEDNDGFLTTAEISELDLDADLVVLSACNTGGAYQARGESLSGLARAFFFAGTRSLLVTHWSVDDEATAELMILVFDYLKKNQTASIAEALTRAQIKMLDNPQEKNWAHPYYWAGFSLVGDGGLGIATESLTATR